jgi:phosphoglucosamine mutase
VLNAPGSRPINDGCGTQHVSDWLREVRGAEADGGMAFDGDADRVLLADRWGRILNGDHMLAALARDLKERGLLAGDRVVGTVMTNVGLEEHLTRMGVRLERTAVGDRHVADRMRAVGAVLGGEPSGHLILPRGGALLGDGLVAGVRVLQAARRRGANLSTLRRDVRQWPQVLKGLRVREKRPLSDVPGLAAAIAEEEASLGHGGRLVVRYSGTEPLLRIMAEGRERSAVQKAVARIEAEARRALMAGV